MIPRAAGIDCPRCSSDPEADPDKKKIRTSLLEFVATRSAHCENCGLVLRLVLDDKGQEALNLASTLKTTLDASAGAMRSR
jgi:uncharacterized Zn finger protein